MKKWLVMIVCWSVVGIIFVQAATPEALQPITLTVDGTVRTALLHVPPAIPGAKLPLVFVFHGHGGSAQNAAGQFKVDQLWPDALSVYPQGLNTPGMFHDPAGQHPGWQYKVGMEGDRDLRFFDALLAQLEKEYPVDQARVYCTGHSNGAIFTYLLWYARPGILAAVAACSGATPYENQLSPKPAMILGGRNDHALDFKFQQSAMDAVRQSNGCDSAGRPWQGVATEYPSKTGTPLVTYIYDGGHAMDPAEPALVVKFFQEHPETPSPGKP